MPRKLLTFLGVADYKPCIYTLNDMHSPVVHYVQEALAGLVCKDWTAEDSICVFLTTDAEQKNWQNEENPYQVLGAELLDRLQLACQVKPITDFKEGFGELQIQSNFKLIYDNLEEGDEVWLDITNAFRSIPFFAAVLLNYAQFLKHIKVKAIFYGAFEVLGVPAHKIDATIPDPAARLVPIINLSSLIELQNWTNAANDFLTHGNAKELSRIAEQQGHHVLARNLAKVTDAFAVVRGREIVNGSIFQDLQQSLQALRTEDAILDSIVDKLSAAFQGFHTEDILNGFRAAQWCYEHQLYQQGITIVREAIVSLICRLVHLPEDNYPAGRKYVETAFNCHGKSPHEWKKVSANDKPLIQSIINQPLLQRHVSIYKDLSYQYRNDINHGGFLHDAKPAHAFAQALYDAIRQLRAIHNF